MDNNDYEYDFGLSFAGEQREYVEQVAEELQLRGIRVFFDDYEAATLWGKDLYSHLSEIYQHLCNYCIIFVSDEYAQKVWPSHERRSAQARALEEKREYILPVRFDDTRVPGLPNTIYYINALQSSPSEIAELARQKLGNPIRQNYLPPVLDRLFERLRVEQDHKAKACVQSLAWSFFQTLLRMSSDERNAVVSLIRFGCPADLPYNIHINVDLLRRHTGKSVARLKRLLGDVRSLGFECSIRESTDEHSFVQGTLLGESYLFELNWFDLSDREEEIPALVVASEMVSGATEGYCEEHGTEFLERLDFSQLASATATRENEN